MNAGDNVADNGNAEPLSALIFLGTGCSSAVPNAMCLIQPSDPPCQLCFQSLSIPPEHNPNYREQVLRWFTFHKIPRVDSIVLTHEHADAVLGLDDVRAVQPYSPINDIDPTPIYLTQFAVDSIGVKFPYLVKKKPKAGQEVRRVAQLDCKIIENDCKKPFVVSGLELTPLPVMHGEDYISLGFLFGEKYRVAYISDVSRFLPPTEHYISKGGAGQVDLLILDTLCMKGSHNVRFCFPQTLEAVKKLCPKQALLIGMTHEFDHHKDNEFLAEWSRSLHMMG